MKIHDGAVTRSQEYFALKTSPITGQKVISSAGHQYVQVSSFTTSKVLEKA